MIGEDSEVVRKELSDARNEIQDAWRVRFELAQKTGDLPAYPKAADLARYVMTVFAGITVQTRSGATKQELRSMVEVALLNWPSD